MNFKELKIKKKFMATMVALSLSTPLWADDKALITESEVAAADMQMLFVQDAQALRVVALSADEMKETQGAWNLFEAIANLFKKPDVPAVVPRVVVAAAVAIPVATVAVLSMMTGVGEVAIAGTAIAAAGEAAEGAALLGGGAAAADGAAVRLVGRLRLQQLDMQLANNAETGFVLNRMRQGIDPAAARQTWLRDLPTRIRSVPTPVRNRWSR